MENRKPSILLPILLGVFVLTSLFMSYKYYMETRSAKQVREVYEEKYRDRGDSLQSVRNEANQLAFEVDSLGSIITEGKIKVKYEVQTVYRTNETNKDIAHLYNSPTDSTKILIFTNLLRDTTYTVGSGRPTRIESN